jgi:uncharacterized ferredoxin-like protein
MMSSAGTGDLTAAIIQVAGMMEMAARTSPKTRGEDFVKTLTLKDVRLKELSEAMVRFGIERKKTGFDRDASNVATSNAIVLIGLKDSVPAGLNCGACGFASCDELKASRKVDVEYRGPECAFRMVDLGIAVGSAVKTAQVFNVDNRVMYRAGAAARWAKLVDWDFVLGIPLAATGKNIFFDRK